MLQNLELHGELLSMLCLEFFVGDLFEAEAEIPLVVDSFNQVLLNRLLRVLFDEAAHAFDGALGQVSLRFDSFKEIY